MDQLMTDDETEMGSLADARGLLSVADALEGEEEEEDDDEFESEDKLQVFDVEEHAKMVVAILKPVSFTMVLVVWLVRLIQTVNISVK